MGTLAHASLCFYCGGIACLVWQWLQRRKAFILPSAIVFGSLGAASLWIYVRNFAELAECPILGAIVFPIVIFKLALLQGRFPAFGRSASKFGDLTYALLLVHFPIQLATILVCKAWGFVIDFTQPATLLAFVSISVSVAAVVHYWFELPFQSVLAICSRR